MARTNDETCGCTRVASEEKSRRMPFKLLDGQRNVSVGTQTEISISDEGKWIDVDQAEEEIDPFTHSDDDIPDDDVELSAGEIRAIIKQKRWSCARWTSISGVAG